MYVSSNDVNIVYIIDFNAHILNNFRFLGYKVYWLYVIISTMMIITETDKNEKIIMLLSVLCRNIDIIFND